MAERSHRDVLARCGINLRMPEPVEEHEESAEVDEDRAWAIRRAGLIREEVDHRLRADRRFPVGARVELREWARDCELAAKYGTLDVEDFRLSEACDFAREQGLSEAFGEECGTQPERPPVWRRVLRERTGMNVDELSESQEQRVVEPPSLRWLRERHGIEVGHAG